MLAEKKMVKRFKSPASRGGQGGERRVGEVEGGEGGEEGEEGGAGAGHRVAVQGAAGHGQPGGVSFSDPFLAFDYLIWRHGFIFYFIFLKRGWNKYLVM